jgi:hypothetical protein
MPGPTTGAEAELFRDPQRVAALLVRAFSSQALSSASGERADEGDDVVTQGKEGGEEEDDGASEQEENEDTMDDPDEEAGSNIASSTTGGEEEEEEDNTEQVEEELEQEEEQEMDEDKRPLDEEELEAAASALLAATRIVDELRLNVVLKAGHHMERQLSVKDGGRERMGSGSIHRPGVPRVGARAVDSDQCTRCNRSFNPFHRSKNCTTCGFTFCPKCVSNQQVLPTCFGHKSDAMRVCDLCSAWFQKALDRYFDAMDLLKPASTPKPALPPTPTPTPPPSQQQQQSPVQPSQEPSRRSGSGENDSPAPRSIGINSFTGPPSSASSVPEGTTRSDRGYTNDESISDRLFQRRSRRSQSISLVSKSPVTRPWFSGHLRAMHVGDRLPRKHKASADGSELDADTSGSSRDFRSSVARTQSFGGPSYSSPIVLPTSEDGRRHGKSPSPGAISSDGVLSKSPEPVSMPIPDLLSLPETLEKHAAADEVKTKSLPRSTSRRSRFGRSASFDLTTLHPPSQSPTASMLGSPSKEISGRASELSADSSPLDMITASSDPKSFLLKKCFDDSDIVDDRRADISANEGLRDDADLPAAVLRFAVYEMGAKENAGVRRALGFAKANPVLDRYTLELDCRQGIVRVKSVFMHRFWWFHCDTVQSFSVGSSVGTARLIIFNGGHGNQTLELKFANNEEREQFRQAMESCRSTNIHSMKRYTRRIDVSSNGEDATSCGSPPLHGNFPQELEVNGDPTSEGGPGSPEFVGLDPPCTVSSPRHISVDFPYFPGEELVKDTELPATLLIGPAGESLSFETSMVWGRLRGIIAVTNYRVLFTPFDRIPLLSRPAEQYSAAYIPLFSITQVQLLNPGGRRTKSGRTYYAGMTGSASIISITCKDVRVLRFQLDGPQMLSDERTQKLYTTISKMSDSSQRYAKVESPLDAEGSGGASSDFMALTGSSTFSSGSADMMDSSDDQQSGPDVRNNRLSYAKSPFGPISATSPVLRPTFDASVLRERPGCFAFSYSSGWVPPDQNGWNLFIDEREFKRQIGGDTAVSPFLKVGLCPCRGYELLGVC